MKIFIIAFLFVLATVFPILFFPLLALTIVIGLAISPYVMTHGLGIWRTDEHSLDSPKH